MTDADIACVIDNRFVIGEVKTTSATSPKR